jgi:hypothetical protein
LGAHRSSSEPLGPRPEDATVSGPRASPFCLACGYERAGIADHQACPECGHAVDEHASRAVAHHFDAPFRRAFAEIRGRIPLGWWCLLPTRAQLAARLQLVTWLTLTTLSLLVFLAGGAHIRLWIAANPIRTVATTVGIEAVLIDNAILGGLLPGDIGWKREPGARSFVMNVPVGTRPTIPHIEVVSPNWSPFFIATITWAACLPAAGLLGLRFILLPLTLRLQRRSLSLQTRCAASVAADATVASAAIGCCVLTIGTATCAFLIAPLLPNATAIVLGKALPMVLMGELLLLPPLLFANAMWHDRSRRVFSWPKLAATLSFASYFVGVGLGVAVIAATFAIAVRLLV